MARLLFEEQAVRTRRGSLATGIEFVVYTDAAGTVLADISATSGALATSTATVVSATSTITSADIAELGPSALKFYGPDDDTDTLYLRCPADASLGVQEIEAAEGERLDALEVVVVAHPNLAVHDALGLATDAELSLHADDTTSVHGITDTSVLATSSSVAGAVSTHAAAADPHGDRAYADAVAQGLDIKAAVQVASTGALTLSGEQTIDGVLTSGSRVLVKNQAAGAANGIYVSAAGAWARAADADTGAEVDAGTFVFVESGTVNGGTGWAQTVSPVTLGTTALVFSQFSSGGTIIGGAGLVKTGNTLDIGAGTGIAVAGDTVGIAPGGVTNTQVDASAAIAESKLALAFPTHAESHAARHGVTGADPLTGYTTLQDLFGPPSIPGLALWFAADRITGLADAAAVSSWADLSGNARHATQATGTAQPTYRTGIINGLPAVLFDGTSDYLQTPTFLTLSKSTILAVVKLTTTSGNRDVTDGSSGGRHTLGIRSGNFITQAGGSASAGPAANTNSHVLTGVFTGSTTSGIAVDGTASATSNIGAQELSRLTIGGQGASPGEYLAGYVAELIVYAGILTAAQRQQIEWHLATKYGLATASTFDPDQQAASVARGSRLTVTDRGLWVATSGSDSNDGLSPGTAKATVQAALDGLDTAGGGEATILGGTYTQTAELTANVGSDKPMRLRGMGWALTGTAATTLQWATDLGIGKFAIKPVTAGSNYAYLTLENLRLLGPNATVAFGVFPANMDGVQMARRVVVQDSQIRGFRSGVKIVADHNRLERIDIKNCGYGIYWQDMTSYGDHVLLDCDLTAQSIASCAVGTAGQVLGCTVIHGHVGYCPYGWYLEPGRDPSGSCLHTVNFYNASFESMGNGVMTSPDQTAKTSNIFMVGCGTFSHYPSHQISGTPPGPSFKLGIMDNWELLHHSVWINPGYLQDDATGFDATAINGLRLTHFAARTTLATSLANSRPLIRAQSINGRWVDIDTRTLGFLAKPNAAVTIRQLLGVAGNSKPTPYATARAADALAPLVGVALNAAPTDTAASQEALWVTTEGYNIPVDTDAILSGTELIADPASLNKVTNSDGSFEVHVGQRTSGIFGGPGTTAVNLRPGRAAPITRRTVTGSRAGNAALADLLGELAALGIITDSSSA